MHAGRLELGLIVTQQRIALNHLGATGVTGDDDLLHIGKLSTIADSGDDFVECRIRTQVKRRGGHAASHPVIALPAQYAVSHWMARDVGLIEKLRRNHQGGRALSCPFSRVFCTLAIGFGIAQAAMDDDQHPFDFRRCRADAHRDLTRGQQQATGAEFLDPLLGSLGACAGEQ
ncbi:hypothetical protein D3C87_1214270 [compost metagenome]